MTIAPWCIATGIVLLTLALISSLLKRVPLSSSMLAMIAGVALGPLGVGLLRLDLVDDAALIEILSEVAVIISLFAAGLQLRLPLGRIEWRLAVRLATLSMTLTVALTAAIGVFALGLPWGAAVILGALLAPTDPVLAAEVQVKNSTDSDRLRFVLTGEAGFNDGAAFPFIMLGLGLLGAHDLGSGWWRWWAIDVAWAIIGGLGIGALLGSAVAKLVLYLRQRRREAVGLDHFLAVGLIALSYGAAMYAAAYGFLAVFAAGVALRRVERRADAAQPSDVLRSLAGGEAPTKIATGGCTAPAYMAEAVLNFNAQLERFAEVALVVLTGSLLSAELWTWRLAAVVTAMLLIVRPLAVRIGLLGTSLSPIQKNLVAWFGIRGIGSIYYLTYAIVHGLQGAPAEQLANVALATIATSIVVHGVSVTPLMNYYARHGGGRE
jgi:NhaP-type Na+/H+ or K+/H+ antiporter